VWGSQQPGHPDTCDRQFPISYGMKVSKQSPSLSAGSLGGQIYCSGEQGRPFPNKQQLMWGSEPQAGNWDPWAFHLYLLG
jgi:hypothetical protein